MGCKGWTCLHDLKEYSLGMINSKYTPLKGHIFSKISSQPRNNCYATSLKLFFHTENAG